MASWLRPGGLLFVHIFVENGLPYHFLVSAPEQLTGSCWPECNDLLAHVRLFCTAALHGRRRNTLTTGWHVTSSAVAPCLLRTCCCTSRCAAACHARALLSDEQMSKPAQGVWQASSTPV